MSPTEEVREELEQLSADLNYHSIADLVYKLFLRGLEQYRLDGRLASPRELNQVKGTRDDDDNDKK